MPKLGWMALVLAGAALAQSPAPIGPAAGPGTAEPGGPQPVMVRRPMGPPPARSGTSADLPVTLIAGMPTVEVMVDGKGPFRVGIETGFPRYLRLSPEAAATAGLKQIGEAMTSDPSGRNPQRVPVHQAGELKLGGLAWRDVTATVAPMLSARLKGVDGLIGLGLFADLLLTVDYGKGRMTLAPGKLDAGPGVLPVTRVRGMLLSIPLTIGERTWPVHLDTGNSRHALFMPTAAIPQLPTSGAAFAIGKARTVSQEVELSAQKLTAPVKAGGTILKVDEVAFPSLIDEGNLGSLGLAGQVLTLDLANGRARIAPSR